MANLRKDNINLDRSWDFDECVGAIVFGVPTALCCYEAGVITVEIIHMLVNLI
jgi:hypothetical protein